MLDSQPSTTVEPLLDQDRVAEQLGVRSKTLEAWRSRGGGPPFVRVGRLVRYRSSAVESWIRSRERRSTSDHGSVGEHSQ
jgi:excisionase family DNA binding protein